MKKWMKIAAIVAASLVGLLLLILIVIPLVLTPQRLTNWTRNYGTEYLVDGKVEVKEVDLSIWSTFPHAQLKVDSLVVENNALPDSVSKVIFMDYLKANLHLPSLLIGRLRLDDTFISSVKVDLWTSADSTLSSLSILPPSEPEEAKEEKPLELPDIVINDFRITGELTLNYVNEHDSIEAQVEISDFSGLSNADEQYLAEIYIIAGAKPYVNKTLVAGLDGGIKWRPSKPLSLTLNEFRVYVDKITTVTSADLDFSQGIAINSLDFELKPLKLTHLSQLADSIPMIADMVPDMGGDASLGVKAHLRKPYVYNPDTLLIPDMELYAAIDDSDLKLPEYHLAFTNFGLKANASLSDRGLDASSIDLKRLRLQIHSTDLTLKGSATNLTSDPKIQACLEGSINFSNVDPRVWPLIGVRLDGKLDADIDVDTRLSYLTPNAFHNMRLKGDATLTDFAALLPSDTIAAGLTRANIHFGSSDSFKSVDSLLMASVKVDSLWVEMPDLKAQAGGLRLGAGVSNTAATADTSTVTPMGGYLAVKSLTYSSATDSTRARVHGLAGGLTLSRYKGDNRTPKLSAKLAAKRLVYADGTNRASLRGLSIAASAHPSKKKKEAGKKNMRNRRDSIALVNNNFETLDFGIDRSAVTMLRRMNVSGNLKADGGRVMTPLFPLRTRLRNLDMAFNADSVMLNSLKITAGVSDLALSGSISNIQRSLGRKNTMSPIRLTLNLESDAIDVNQLTRAAFRGAAYAAKADSLKSGNTNLDADDDALQAEADAEASGETMAIVVPMNIDAKINVNARNIIYSTLDLKDLRGEILVANGAANLSGLHAATDIGSVDLNMLYYAPTRQDVNFGVGLDLHRFNIGRITELMPTLDSIMPILNTLGGVIDVGISATTPVDSAMNIKLPELSAMVHLAGDSLRVLDEKTFKTVSKWLLFHDKNKNMIDHMDVQLSVDDNQLNLYPFMFDFDRYRIGVMGNNDLALNLNYHVSILKSPIPFKFGINIKGTADKMKIRLGRARFKENMAAESRQLSDTVRINLANEIKNVFARGAKAARLGSLTVRRPRNIDSIPESADTLTAADSLYFRQNGLTL